MIRTTMTTLLAAGLFALTGISAMAAPDAAHRHGRATIVAQAEGTAPAADTATPQKKVAKKIKVAKPGKDKGAADVAATTSLPEKAPKKK